MSITRPRLLAATLALAVAPALAACGSDSEDAGSDAGSSESSSSEESAGAEQTEGGVEDGAFPVTIDHKYGSTEITEAPERVVTIGLVDQDALLALGVVPVGVTYWFGDEELGGINPWAEEAIGDAERPTLLKDTDGVDVEAIAALAPDLIIGQYAGTTEREYELLSQLAPTVAQPGDYADFGVPWQEATETIGEAIGRPAAAEELVEETETVISDAAEANPEFEGRTGIVVTPFEGLFVYGPEDPRTQVLTELGFEFPEEFISEGEEFGESLSAERTSDLDDVDVTVWLDLAAEPAVETVYEQTPAFEEGRFVDIAQAETENYAVAFSFVSPLSIPYVIERYVPQLAAAVDGDPSTVPPVPAD